mmetsp:Transcript_73582/g.225049  ORF Transcript_73582/g.225049 Transcript_73582/m.225049 type:complete len:293 (-) Transcript_73582:294-1172(-)
MVQRVSLRVVQRVHVDLWFRQQELDQLPAPQAGGVHERVLATDVAAVQARPGRRGGEPAVLAVGDLANGLDVPGDGSLEQRLDFQKARHEDDAVAPQAAARRVADGAGTVLHQRDPACDHRRRHLRAVPVDRVALQHRQQSACFQFGLHLAFLAVLHGHQQLDSRLVLARDDGVKEIAGRLGRWELRDERLPEPRPVADPALHGAVGDLQPAARHLQDPQGGVHGQLLQRSAFQVLCLAQGHRGDRDDGVARQDRLRGGGRGRCRRPRVGASPSGHHLREQGLRRRGHLAHL